MATFVAPTSAGSGTRQQITPGVYMARCYQMVDLGTHDEEFQGETKRKRKIRLGWEFPDEKAVFSEEKGEEPFSIGKEYAFSMHEKSTFRFDLESWRGQKFTDDQARVFDAGKLLGAVCQINVVAYTKRDGSSGVKIGSISPLMRGMICPPQINKTQSLSLAKDEFDHSTFNDLPKFLREKIEASPEYKTLNGQPSEPEFTGYSGPPKGDDQDEPLPF